MRGFVIGVAVAVLLGGLVGAQQLSGEWELELTVDPSQASFAAALDFTTDITVNYEVGGWTFSSVSKFNDGGWYDQDFSASGALGAWTFASAVDFNPVTGTFGVLDIDTGIALGGMTFDVDFTLTDKDVLLVLGGSGSTSLVDITVAVYFGDIRYTGAPCLETWVGGDDICNLDWSGLRVDFGFPFCCADISGRLYFDCDGFQYIYFDVAGIAIPNLPWVTIGGRLMFQTDSKTLTLSPAFDFGADVCFDLYIDQVDAGGVGPAGGVLDLSNFLIEGIGLQCEIGGIAFTAISYWGAARFWNGCFYDLPGILAWKGGAYWEAYKIATTDDACCGPFAFDITVYFDDATGTLFDIALFEASMTLQVAAQFTFGMGLEYNVATGAQLWELDFTVTW